VELFHVLYLELFIDVFWCVKLMELLFLSTQSL
jgi:hypothetical protein